MRKVFIFLFLLFFIFFTIHKPAFARDYIIDYQVEYRPVKKEGQITTKVNFNIKITHLRSDIYVNKFKLFFPESFLIHEVEGYDDKGRIDVTLEKKNFNNELTINLTNPNTGKNSVNNIYISFFQEKVFKEIGNIIEGYIPTINDKEINSYQAVIFLPKALGKKLSLSKPIPTLIKQNNDEIVISWDNVKEKTIYTIFAEEQYYDVRLVYQLKNNQVYPGYQLVAFLPETSYQKVYIDKIQPQPEMMFLDDDNNLMGKYLLLPQQSKEIIFEGKLIITNNGNFEKINYDRKHIVNKKKYFLSQTDDWQIKNIPAVDLSKPELIYQFIIEKLEYNYNKVGKINKRSSPDEILANGANSICLDYTDLYVSLARENGINSRAIIGYGYSQEERLRPILLRGDILHSWPEYFDDEKQIWRPVDPTWGDTSGIDYFSSLDFNHIAFVILGKNSDKPLPAGMYKLDQQQKIFINPTSEKPKEKIVLKVEKLSFPKKILTNSENQIEFIVKNLSNVYLYDLPITFKSIELDFHWQNNIIDVLPPLAQKEFNVKFTPKKKYQNNLNLVRGKVQLEINNNLYYQSEFTIVPLYFQVSVIFIALSFLSSIVFLAFKIKKRKIKKIY